MALSEEQERELELDIWFQQSECFDPWWGNHDDDDDRDEDDDD